MSRRGVRRHKYGAVPTVVDGIRFASKAEARRFGELKLLEKAGEVSDIEVQPVFPIEVICPWNGEVIQVGVYRADFRYWSLPANGRAMYPTARQIVEDVKGMKTPVYRLKKKLVEALYGISIREIQ
jgi:hypothetical protein